MTKERFFQIAKESGIDPENQAVIDMWRNRPPLIVELMKQEKYDPVHEMTLREMFESVARACKVIEDHSKALNN